jgi:hypothetical protein
MSKQFPAAPRYMFASAECDARTQGSRRNSGGRVIRHIGLNMPTDQIDGTAKLPKHFAGQRRLQTRSPPSGHKCLMKLKYTINRY